MKSGRLSLRARLLVLLIAVTAAFLVIMGGVTTLVLSRRLNTQFNADLLATAARRPQALAGAANGDLAAAISVRARTVVLLTPGGMGPQFQQALSQLTRQQLRRDYERQPFPVILANGTRLRAVARLAAARQLSGTALPPGLVLVVVARPVTALTGQVHGVVVAELITGGGLLLLLAVGGRWLIGRGLSPLSAMAHAARRITAQGDLAARMPDSDESTEVGRLGAAINTMLDRIQQAFGARLRSEQKVRQFAADASHELRTPLTTIRGYAELYRQGALGPGDLPDAMRRIEQESQRMSTLVAELLELARLDRPTSLDLAETDLSVLVRDAVADACAVEPGRLVRAEAPEEFVAVVDEARIRQVLANLVTNVREHTPPGTPAVMRLSHAHGGVLLEVADAGPGMSAPDAARAFDRFHRAAGNPSSVRSPSAPGSPGAAGQPGPASFADGGNRPDNGGSGLGLAIVQAIAQAHGGYARLDSEAGRGTRVQVWIPRASHD